MVPFLLQSTKPSLHPRAPNNWPRSNPSFRTRETGLLRLGRTGRDSFRPAAPQTGSNRADVLLSTEFVSRIFFVLDWHLGQVLRHASRNFVSRDFCRLGGEVVMMTPVDFIPAFMLFCFRAKYFLVFRSF